MANNKDWTGNSRSVYSILGSSSHSEKDRETNDYYATQPIAVEKLLNYYELPHCIWEPACGEGHISKVLVENGFEVISQDLVDRGYGEGGVDFFKQDKAPFSDNHAIVTNPPYKYACDFVKHAIELSPVVVMYLKTTFLESQRRYDEIFSKYRPKWMFQFVRRYGCMKNGIFDGDGAVAYAWYVWERDYNGDTMIRWIP